MAIDRIIGKSIVDKLKSVYSTSLSRCHHQSKKYHTIKASRRIRKLLQGNINYSAIISYNISFYKINIKNIQILIKMKLLVILFIVKLYARINIFLNQLSNKNYVKRFLFSLNV